MTLQSAVVMNPYLRSSAVFSRASALALRPPGFPRTAESARCYATQSDMGRGAPGAATPRRRNVTVLSDDGRYEWGELSGREKAARATQQSINFVVVLAGAVLTVSESDRGVTQ